MPPTTDQRERLAAAERLRPPTMAQSIPAIRHGAAGSAVGDGVIWAQVIRGLQYADSEGTPPEGYGSYICRLLSSTYTAWVISTEYNVNDLRTDDTFLYKCTAPHTSAANNKPGVGEYWDDYWDLQTEKSPIVIGQGSEIPDPITNPPDMRDFIPWFQTNDIIPLVTRTVGEQLVYYIALQMIRVRVLGSSECRSLMWNTTGSRAMAVYGDGTGSE